MRRYNSFGSSVPNFWCSFWKNVVSISVTFGSLFCKKIARFQRSEAPCFLFHCKVTQIHKRTNQLQEVIVKFVVKSACGLLSLYVDPYTEIGISEFLPIMVKISGPCSTKKTKYVPATIFLAGKNRAHIPKRSLRRSCRGQNASVTGRQVHLMHRGFVGPGEGT